MEHATTFLVLGVTVLLIALLVVYATSTTKQAQKLPNQLTNSIDQTTAEINELQYTKYCNSDMTGSDVVTAIRKFKNDGVVVQVTTYVTESQTKTMDTLGELGGSFQNLPTNSTYINPAALFTGDVKRNTNGVIEKLVFKQNKYVSVAQGGNYVDNGKVATTFAPTTEEDTKTNTSFASIDNSLDGVSNKKQSNSQSSDSTDLDIIFSDETNKSTSSAETQYLQGIQNTIDNYSSKLDDIKVTIEQMSVDEDAEDTITNVKGMLTDLLEDATRLSNEITSSKTLGKDQIKKLSSDLSTIKASISESNRSLNELKAQLVKYKENNSKWFIGYPVASNVQAKLTNGTLTISGKGRTDIGHGLPKWRNRYKEIKKVIFDDTVTPTNIDYWFSDCINLSSINFIPKSVTSANGTFKGCSKLTGDLKIKSNDLASLSGFRTCTNKMSELTVMVNDKSKTMDALKSYIKRIGMDKCALRIEVIK